MKKGVVQSIWICNTKFPNIKSTIIDYHHKHKSLAIDQIHQTNKKKQIPAALHIYVISITSNIKMFKICEHSYTKVVRYLECCHNNHTHTECTGQWIDPLWVPAPLLPEKKLVNKSEIHNSTPSIFFKCH